MLVPVAVLQLCDHRIASHVLPFPLYIETGPRGSPSIPRGGTGSHPCAECRVRRDRKPVTLFCCDDLPLKLFRVKRLVCLDQDGTAVRMERVQDLAVVSLTAADTKNQSLFRMILPPKAPL